MVRFQSRDFLILTYHRFPPKKDRVSADILSWQCAHLRKYFNPVSMSQIGIALRGGKPLPPNAVTITVDDGYGDFRSFAAPIFEAYDIPVTVYLITDFVDGKLWPWWDQLAFAVHHTSRPFADIALDGDGPACHVSTRTDPEREVAISKLVRSLTQCPNQVRLSVLNHLPDTFETDVPKQRPPEYAPLTWDDARALESRGVEFGAHTVTHPILPSVEDKQAMHDEVAGSKARIEQQLHHPVLHFAYPNGDFNDSTVAEVASDEFLTAVTVMSGLNPPTQYPYLLHRVSACLDIPDYYFKELVAGIHS